MNAPSRILLIQAMWLGNDCPCTIHWSVEIKMRCDGHHKNGSKHPMAQRRDRSTLNGES